MDMLEREGEEGGDRQVVSEHQRGRDNDDQYHSVRSGSTDSSPNRHAAPESVVSNRNKAVHAERARRRAELVAKKRGVVPSKPEARKVLLRKYMPELAVKIPRMAHEKTQSHLLSSTSSEGSGGETTPPPAGPSDPSPLTQAVPPPSKDEIDWNGDVDRATSGLVTLLTANGESTLDTNTLELGLGTLRAIAARHAQPAREEGGRNERETGRGYYSRGPR
ncbi:unnamed protein product [Arctia plantaginis]|uniref:Uncharacterized protein n=1 Tax=Arctia plantaginis TaxID=874455 RepID=A0A8S0ZAS0_ARCPL|nr:unnamed protein product [Arctia plantaginis]